MHHPFNDEELTTLFEAARVAFSDAELFDWIAEQMDLSDDYMTQLREKLQCYMDKEIPTE